MTDYKGTGTDGNRIARLAKAREEQQRKFAEQKKAIEEKHRIESIRSKFASNKDDVEEKLKQATVGLVSHADFKRTREVLEQQAFEQSKKEKGCSLSHTHTHTHTPTSTRKVLTGWHSTK